MKYIAMIPPPPLDKGDTEVIMARAVMSSDDRLRVKAELLSRKVLQKHFDPLRLD